MKLSRLYNLLFFLLLVVCCSCKLMLIGEYDEIADQYFQKIQGETTALVIRIEKNIQNNTPRKNSYDSLENQYIAIESDIKTLQVRCTSLPKYGIIGSQLNTIADNIQLLEQYNKTPPGFTTLLPVTIIDSTLNIQFAAVDALQYALKRQKK
jgi:hypothetical protein